MKPHGWQPSTNPGFPGEEERATHARPQDTARFPAHDAGNRAALLFLPRSSLDGAAGQIHFSIGSKPAVQLPETGIDFFFTGRTVPCTVTGHCLGAGIVYRIRRTSGVVEVAGLLFLRDPVLL